MPKRAVLIANLGSPESASVGDVRRYLREFLGDERVLDIPAPLRWLLLETVILPTRPKRTAGAGRRPREGRARPCRHALRDALDARGDRRPGRGGL
jgi:protoheme ferro-lyase